MASGRSEDTGVIAGFIGEDVGRVADLATIVGYIPRSKKSFRSPFHGEDILSGAQGQILKISSGQMH